MIRNIGCIATTTVALLARFALPAAAFNIQVSEIWPGQDGSDVTEDWFEIVNIGNTVSWCEEDRHSKNITFMHESQIVLHSPHGLLDPSTYTWALFFFVGLHCSH